MEFSVDRGLDAWNRIQSSADPQLRLVTIPKSTAAIPAADFAEPVAWAAAGPKTVGAFSAACFYMAQGLRRDLGIPIGAIASDWGGSQARAWLAPGPARRLDREEHTSELQSLMRNSYAVFCLKKKN